MPIYKIAPFPRWLIFSGLTSFFRYENEIAISFLHHGVPLAYESTSPLERFGHDEEQDDMRVSE